MAYTNLPDYRNTHLPDAQWIKGGRSELEPIVPDCFAFTTLPDGMIGVTDTKHPDAPVLYMKRSEMRALRDSFANGDFDHLT